MTSSKEMTGAPASAAVRVLTVSGEVVGAGFVVGSGLVATCAHVVAEAVGADPGDEHPPTEPVLLDFPLLSGDTRHVAHVRRWTPVGPNGDGDIAVLEVASQAPDLPAAPPFWHAREPWGREFRMLGFPLEIADGVWVSGEFRAPRGMGWMQLQAGIGGQSITPGFSGAAVWDSGSDAVVGMAVAADRRRYTRTAFMIPIDEVLGLDPTLRPNPYRGLERFEEADAHLFYGRGPDIDRIVAAVEQRRLVAVTGQSGTGKSSLVSAGVIPRLRKRGIEVVALRAAGDTTPDSLTARLPESAAGRRQQGRVLFVDQFEDLAATDPERARALFRRLVDLTTDSAGDPPPRVVLTLRWEALNDLVDDEFAEAIDGAMVTVAPMGREQLRQVIRGPATEANGVVIDGNLIDRLVDDTVHQPGGLPLLESMLTELWAQRRGGRLTLADYERVGRVGGSITRQAERALAQFAASNDAAAARRLLTLLAVPDISTDGFIRSVIPIDDYPELRTVAGHLARERLVVVGRRLGGAETVELAHQALIDNWPLLRGWLESDRAFRSWQQRLEHERSGWAATRFDDAGLLRGSALARAEEWLATRGSDIPQTQQQYIGSSLRLRRREVRRWRTVAAVVTVLAVLASTTAIFAYRTSQQRESLLREAAGISLARESVRLADTDPLTALQFAQGAERNAPGNSEVEAALLTQQIAFSGVSSYTPGYWADPANLAASADGSVFVVAGKDGSVTSWTDVLQGHPTPWQLRPPGSKPVVPTNVSRDGSRIALATERGGVFLWDIRNRQGPITVRPDGAEQSLESTVGLFSPDGTRLVLSTNPDRNKDRNIRQPDRIEVFDTATVHPVRIAAFSTGEPVSMLPERIDLDNRTIWFTEQSFATSSMDNVVRAADSGHRVRRLPSGSVTADGAVAECEKTPNGGTSDYVIQDGITGAERRRIALPSGICDTAVVDRSGRYAVMTDYSAGATYGLNYLADLNSGQLFTFQSTPGLTTDGYFVHPTPAGPDVSVFTPTGLVHYKPAIPVDDANDFRDPPRATTLAFDGQIAANYYDDQATGARRIELVQISPRQRRLSEAALGSGPGQLDIGQGDLSLSITRDDRFLLVIGQPNELRVYSTADLGLVRTLALPVPAGLDTPGPWDGKDIMPLDNGDVAIFYAGMLTRWDINTGRRLGEPIPVYQDAGDLHTLATTGKAAPRLDRPGEILIGTPFYFKVWDIIGGRRVATWLPEGVKTIPDAFFYQSNAPEVYVDHQIWNMDTGRVTTPAYPVPDSADIIGRTTGGLLLVGNGDVVEAWDGARGRLLSFRPPGPVSQVTVQVDPHGDDIAFLVSADGVTRIDLERTNLPNRMCAINDRPYTAAEMRQLPPGAVTAPPCHD
ncbi:trypsin-like peptidase domain-containing protein [Nocardia sp. CA-135953]|uniref:nSTAND1 domain-containing NTPase n=1 Tax=Nocardia sp. CA-135953 TaxID=3239978 RepID=UPI003D974D65